MKDKGECVWDQHFIQNLHYQTYVSYLRMHHNLKHACHISDLHGSRCYLYYVCPSCLYSCYKVAKILNGRSLLIVVRWNNDLCFVECLPTYRVIELVSNLWRYGRNRKCCTKFRVPTTNNNNMRIVSSFIKWEKERKKENLNVEKHKLSAFESTALFLHTTMIINMWEKLKASS
jgi:hypothetical protein